MLEPRGLASDETNLEDHDRITCWSPGSRHGCDGLRLGPMGFVEIFAEPPDWSGGYTSLFALQQEEEWDPAQLETVASQHARVRG